jgi:glycine cleavage system transcriptional repressor
VVVRGETGPLWLRIVATTNSVAAAKAHKAAGRAQRRSHSRRRARFTIGTGSSRGAYLVSLVPDYAVTAIGRDRPGIVAAISKALLELDGNIEDSQMTILRGHFAVMLIVRLGEAASADALGASLGEVRDRLELEALTFEPVDEIAHSRPLASHLVSVYGADHPGIVAGMTAVLASEGVNIIDLETRVAGADEAPIYAMLMEVSLGDASAERVQAALDEAAADAKVEISLRELDSEAL